MGVQQYIDLIVNFLMGPSGWIVIGVVVAFGFFLLRGNPTR